MVAELTLPHNQHTPPHPPKRANRPPITVGVCRPFFLPVGGVVDRRDAGVAARVQVPEAAMHVDDLAQPRKHQVRRAGQITPVKPEAVAETVNEPADDQFGRRSRLRARSNPAEKGLQWSFWPGFEERHGRVAILICQSLSIEKCRHEIGAFRAQTIPIVAGAFEPRSAELAGFLGFYFLRRSIQTVNLSGAFVPTQNLDAGRRSDVMLRDDEAATIIEKEDVPAGVATANGVQEDGPPARPALDLNVRGALVVVIVASEHEAQPVGFTDQDRDQWVGKLQSLIAWVR